jgi:predicted nucleic acid-binding protein
VKVVSDSSPIITFARVGYFHLLPKLYGRIHISTEVYDEIVVAGAGLPGADQADQAGWIEIVPINEIGAVALAIERTGLGAGEVSTVLLTKQLSVDLALIDEQKARRYAAEEGLNVTGCIGILESLYRRGELADLREAYCRLLAQNFRIPMPSAGTLSAAVESGHQPFLRTIAVSRTAFAVRARPPTSACRR